MSDRTGFFVSNNSSTVQWKNDLEQDPNPFQARILALSTKSCLQRLNIFFFFFLRNTTDATAGQNRRVRNRRRKRAWENLLFADRFRGDSMEKVFATGLVFRVAVEPAREIFARDSPSSEITLLRRVDACSALLLYVNPCMSHSR